MSAERELIGLHLSETVSVFLVEFITGREKRAIQRPWAEQAQIKSSAKQVSGKMAKEGTVEVGGVSGTVNELMEDEAIKQIVKKIKDGEREITDKNEILNFILDLREDQYSLVVSEINKVTDPKKA